MWELEATFANNYKMIEVYLVNGENYVLKVRWYGLEPEYKRFGDDYNGAIKAWQELVDRENLRVEKYMSKYF